MQEWIAEIIAKVIQLVGKDLVAAVKKMWAEFKRSGEQKKTADAVKADQGKPRSPEVDQHELDDINS